MPVFVHNVCLTVLSFECEEECSACFGVLIFALLFLDSCISEIAYVRCVCLLFCHCSLHRLDCPNVTEQKEINTLRQVCLYLVNWSENNQPRLRIHEFITSVVLCLHDMVVQDNGTLTTLDGYDVLFCSVIYHIIGLKEKSLL